MVFGTNEQERDLGVAIFDDNLVEQSETIVMTLSNARMVNHAGETLRPLEISVPQGIGAIDDDGERIAIIALWKKGFCWLCDRQEHHFFPHQVGPCVGEQSRSLGMRGTHPLPSS